MSFTRRVTLADIPLMLICAITPLYIYRIVAAHQVSEDRKVEPQAWLNKNPDLCDRLLKEHGVILNINKAVPGTLMVSCVNLPNAEDRAIAGLPTLLDELFKHRCPYGITMVTFQVTDADKWGENHRH